MTLAFIARLVTNHVPPIVKITHVKYRTELVFNVHLDGLGPLVLIVIFFLKKSYFYRLSFVLYVTF